MDTPICDFVRSYAEKKQLRLHMPGHKGIGPLGFEVLDITEIDGADSLYEANGIIRQSEDNASALFGCPTYYSTEGSSLCIRAMLYLTVLHAHQAGKRPLVAAGRNAHKTFLTAAAMLDLDVVWMYPQGQDSYISCSIDAQALELQLSQMDEKPVAVYLTSPDYLGNMADIHAISQVCHHHGILLLVDNAHGAYLRFLPQSQHPMDLGADLCCDSAHKTLPVLTGGAYLHSRIGGNVKHAMAMFGSTSPSYLILQSLDAANRYLSDGYRQKLTDFIPAVDQLKAALIYHGYALVGNEPLKITISAKPYGYRGFELAQKLAQEGIICEFADPDYVVLMLTPETGSDGLQQLHDALMSIAPQQRVEERPPVPHKANRVMSIRQAALSPNVTIPVSQSLGHVYAGTSIGCPPAVPIVVCGERIDEAAITRMQYYGIESCPVVIE